MPRSIPRVRNKVSQLAPDTAILMRLVAARTGRREIAEVSCSRDLNP